MGQRPRWSSPPYFWWAVVCTIFFFTPAGVVGIVCSVVAKRRASTGDDAGAVRAGRAARMSCWVSLGLGVFLYLLLATGTIHLSGYRT